MSKIEWEEKFKHKYVHDNQELFKNALLDAKKTQLCNQERFLWLKKILLKKEDNYKHPLKIKKNSTGQTCSKQKEEKLMAVRINQHLGNKVNQQRKLNTQIKKSLCPREYQNQENISKAHEEQIKSQ